MGIPVKLEAFEGPLELLLHLIDKNKVNIYDIPIALIAEQYLEYIETLKSKDMELMSEFLVMAATLLKIKSQLLLPKEATEEEEDEEDPRRELVERLLEYKMYKYISYELKDKQLDAAQVVYKKPSIPEEVAGYREEVDLDSLLSDLSLPKLQGIFHSVMKKQEDKLDPIRSQFGRIEKEEVKQEETLLFVEAYAKAHRNFRFRALLKESSSKMELIVTFLCLLELMKLGKLKAAQEAMFDDIYCESLGQRPSG